MKRIIQLTLAIVLLASCNQEKKVLIQEFDSLYESILTLDAGRIDQKLNGQSAAFISDLTSISDITLPNLMDLGKMYGFSEVMLQYYIYFNKELSKNNTSDLFYYFLSSEQAPIFNFFNIYKVEEKKTRISPEIFVAILEKIHGNNYIHWAKFDKENDAFKYDLIYTLQQLNKKVKKRHDMVYRNAAFTSKDDYYTFAVDREDPARYDTNMISHYLELRREMMNEE